MSELKAPGKFGVREASDSGIQRAALKKSLLEKPEKVGTCKWV